LVNFSNVTALPFSFGASAKWEFTRYVADVRVTGRNGHVSTVDAKGCAERESDADCGSVAE
jgi:hypothetical protein